MHRTEARLEREAEKNEKNSKSVSVLRKTVRWIIGWKRKSETSAHLTSAVNFNWRSFEQLYCGEFLLWDEIGVGEERSEVLQIN